MSIQSTKKSKKRTMSPRKTPRQGASAEVVDQKKKNNYLIPLLIALAVTLIVYIPSLSNDFVNWDDDVNIFDNKNLDAFTWENIQNIFHLKKGTVIGNYNPLTIFTFAIEKALVGDDAWLYHVNNLGLHLVCTFLVFQLMRLLNFSPIAAMVVALFFGIHPMRVESVAWVTERKDVLFGAFYLGALYYYTKYIKNGREKSSLLWAVGILFLLSLLSKIQAVSLPLTMLAVDYYFDRPLKFKLILEKIPFFLMSLVFGLLGVYSLKEAGSLTDDVTNFKFIDRLFIGGYSWTVYLIKFIFPYKMVAMYPYPRHLSWEFYAGTGVALASLGLGVLAYFRNMKAVFFGFLFFFFNVVFMLQILGAGQGFIADRFTYIPYLGLFFIIGYYLDQMIKNEHSFGQYFQYGLYAYLAVFAAMSVQQIKTWKNGETLWTHAIENLSPSSLPYGNRGHFRREKLKKYDLAIADYTQAINLESSKAGLYNSRGKTYFDSGKADLAIQDYNKAISLKDTIAEFHVNLGAALGFKGNLNGAMKALSRGIDLDNTYANAFLNRSLGYNQLGQYDLALKDINRYLELEPNSPDLWYEKGMLSRMLGQMQNAIIGLNEAIRIAPRNHKNLKVFYYERAKTQIQLNQIQAAKSDFRLAQQLGASIDGQYQQYLK